MEKHKYVNLILKCSIIVLPVVLTVIIYLNGCAGVIKAKEKARETLRTSAELTVNREYDKLNEPIYFSKRGKKKRTKRKSTTANRTFTVMIDSLKEQQSLYSLEAMGIKASILNDTTSFPLDTLLNNWQKDIEGEYEGGICALWLNVVSLRDSTTQQQYTGDTTICLPQYVLGTFYLDGMYTMTLTAYFAPPAFLGCIDWDDMGILELFVLWILCIFAFLICAFLQWRKQLSAIPNNIYPIGEYFFDAVKDTLTYQGQEILCTQQASKLLYALITAPTHFLTNDEIAHICGWSLCDKGLDERRRGAMKVLRKLFDASDSVKIEYSKEKKGYQLVISK